MVKKRGNGSMKGMDKLGSWAFIAGLILALLFGFISGASWTVPVLVVLGLFVGFLNISERESTPFLVATIALLAAGTANLSSIPSLGYYLEGILANVAVFVAPAAIVVAIKSIYEMASSN